MEATQVSMWKVIVNYYSALRKEENSDPSMSPEKNMMCEISQTQTELLLYDSVYVRFLEESNS